MFLQIKNITRSILLSAPFGFSKNIQYDRQSYLIIQKVLEKNSNCIDIGCHKGEVLSTILKFAPEGRHFAFEPLPDMCKALREKFDSRCEIFQIALSDEKKESEYNYVISNPAYSGLKKRKYDRRDEKDCSISVASDKLDNLIPKNIKIDFIKIDVEGGELGVLKGAVETIKRCRPVIIFEHGLGAADCYDITPEEVYNLLNLECELNISLMERWIKKAPPLTRNEFCRQFYEGRNYYFLAY